MIERMKRPRQKRATRARGCYRATVYIEPATAARLRILADVRRESLTALVEGFINQGARRSAWSPPATNSRQRG